MKFRHEYKHVVNLFDIIKLRKRLLLVFEHDQNALDDGTYLVKSLYFDNYQDKVLREKLDGVKNREKFRIRYYNKDTSYIKLEKKSKINGLCNKESVELTKEECQKIIDGDIEFLINSDNNLKKELYSKMKYQVLRPKVIVTYRRESFVYSPGNVRVTIDTNISRSCDVENFLNPELQFIRVDDISILEVKWDEFLPEVVSSMVQMNNRSSTAFSKYASLRF